MLRAHDCSEIRLRDRVEQFEPALRRDARHPSRPQWYAKTATRNPLMNMPWTGRFPHERPGGIIVEPILAP